MSALARCLIIGFLGFALSSSVRADASPEQAKEARALFERGLAEADAAHWSEAAELFQRALTLRDSPVIRFNLSSALAELGRLSEALELLRALAADARTSDELAQRATRDREAIEKRLANLTIHVNTSVPDYRVLLDERPLSSAEIDVALKLDPKLHSLSLRVGERVLDDEQVELHEGESQKVLLAGELPKPSAPLELSLIGFPRAEHSDTSKRKRRIIWGVSVAAAAVAAGVITGVMLARSKDDSGTAANAFTPGRVGVRVPE